jgi:hypothetical protein
MASSLAGDRTVCGQPAFTSATCFTLSVSRRRCSKRKKKTHSRLHDVDHDNVVRISEQKCQLDFHRHRGLRAVLFFYFEKVSERIVTQNSVGYGCASYTDDRKKTETTFRRVPSQMCPWLRARSIIYNLLSASAEEGADGWRKLYTLEHHNLYC